MEDFDSLTVLSVHDGSGDGYTAALVSHQAKKKKKKTGLEVSSLLQRYYGKSLPFGKDSFNIPQISLLTVEQALADYSVMITELKQQLAATECPVIVFGGR